MCLPETHGGTLRGVLLPLHEAGRRELWLRHELLAFKDAASLEWMVAAELWTALTPGSTRNTALRDPYSPTRVLLNRALTLLDPAHRPPLSVILATSGGVYDIYEIGFRVRLVQLVQRTSGVDAAELERIIQALPSDLRRIVRVEMSRDV